MSTQPRTPDDPFALAAGAPLRVHGGVEVEPVEDTIAVRPRPGSEEAVLERLRSLCNAEPASSPGLILVRLPRSEDRLAVLQQIQEWREQGVVEFATTVLRDKESQLQQILTDEISVRFREDASEEQRQTMERKYGLQVARRNEFVPNQVVMRVGKPLGLQTLEVANQLDAEDGVEFAAPNFISEFRR